MIEPEKAGNIINCWLLMNKKKEYRVNVDLYRVEFIYEHGGGSMAIWHKDSEDENGDIEGWDAFEDLENIDNETLVKIQQILLYMSNDVIKTIQQESRLVIGMLNS